MSKKQLIILFIVIVGVSAFLKLRKENENNFNYRGISYYQVYSEDKPDSIGFCGEVIPLADDEVRERFEKELYQLTYYRHNTRILLKRAQKWFPKIEPILRQHDVPEDFKYMAIVESALSNVVSNRGAAGFWQLMPVTAQNMGLVVNEEIDERFDPIKATHAACRYIKYAEKRFDSWTNVAASYNMGITGVKRQMRVQKINTYYNLRLNKETGRYVYKIIALKHVMENAEKYGFPEYSGGSAPQTTQSIRIDSTIQNLENFAQKYGITLQELKQHNPWLKGQSLTDEEKIYSLELPLSARQSVEVKETNDATVITIKNKRKHLVHTVLKGESLASLASAYDISADSIRRWNNLDEKKLIKGQKIKLYLKDTVN